MLPTAHKERWRSGFWIILFMFSPELLRPGLGLRRRDAKASDKHSEDTKCVCAAD